MTRDTDNAKYVTFVKKSVLIFNYVCLNIYTVCRSEMTSTPFFVFGQSLVQSPSTNVA